METMEEQTRQFRTYGRLDYFRKIRATLNKKLRFLFLRYSFNVPIFRVFNSVSIIYVHELYIMVR